MGRLSGRRAPAVFGGVYLALMILVVWSPVPLTQPIAPFLDQADTGLHNGVGLPLGMFHRALEFLANVIMFVPPALLLALQMRRENWTVVVLIGFVCTVTIEFVQLAFLPARSATISDVIANTLGALIGALLSLWVRARRRRRPRSPGRNGGAAPEE